VVEKEVLSKLNFLNNFIRIKMSKKTALILSFPVFIALWVAIYINLGNLTNLIIYDILSLSKGTHLTESIWFFVFEVPKVFMLLLLIVFLVGIIRSYFSPERTRKLLSGRTRFMGNITAGALGTVTPFCSCSAIPLFLGFIQSGVPLGVTFSFLISAPMVNEVAVVLLFGLFGWQTAMIYLFSGLTLAITSGYIIGKLNLEKYLDDWVTKMPTKKSKEEIDSLSFVDRIEIGKDNVKEIISKVWIYIVLGIGIGAGIHGYIPENFMAELMGKDAWWSVPIAVLIGIPMYSNAAGIIPIVQALLGKGAALGTVLAFMMSVIALSLPEIIILRKVLKLPLIFTFVTIMAIGIIFIGCLFNFIF